MHKKVINVFARIVTSEALSDIIGAMNLMCFYNMKLQNNGKNVCSHWIKGKSKEALNYPCSLLM